MTFDFVPVSISISTILVTGPILRLNEGRSNVGVSHGGGQ
jgi:hypothetical protein